MAWLRMQAMKTSAAVRHFGTKTRLAEALGISLSAVSRWGPEVPRLRAYDLERLTGGVLSASSVAPPPLTNGGRKS